MINPMVMGSSAAASAPPMRPSAATSTPARAIDFNPVTVPSSAEPKVFAVASLRMHGAYRPRPHSSSCTLDHGEACRLPRSQVHAGCASFGRAQLRLLHGGTDMLWIARRLRVRLGSEDGNVDVDVEDQ